MHKVLFLEDERSLVDDLPILLKESGLLVTGTTSIEEALSLLAKEEFDAVLLDIMMPPTEDMDAEEVDYGRVTGVKVVEQMKATKPAVPIVALTVVFDPKIRARMREAGIGEIISKPSEIENIAETLLRVISRSKK